MERERVLTFSSFETAREIVGLIGESMIRTARLYNIKQVAVTKAVRLFLLVLLFVIWLFPLAWVGSTLGRLPFRVPTRLWQQYNAAALFTKRTPTWADWRIEVRTEGSNQWQVIDTKDVSPMPTSGYRQRMDRILGDTRSKKIAESLRRRLAEWIAGELKIQSGQKIDGLRYLYRSWKTNSSEQILPNGRWNGDEMLSAAARVSILGEYAITDGRAKLVQAEPIKTPVKPSQPKIFRRESFQRPSVKS